MEPTAPGWYPHPNRPGIHWWDGRQWADGPAGAAPNTAPYPSPYAPPSYPAAPYPGRQGPAPYPGPTYAAPQAVPQYPPSQYPPPPPYAPQAGRLRTAAHTGNSYAITTMIVSAVYVMLALTVGIVLLGIFPALMTVRSFQARERLAPVALVAAVVAVGIAIALYRR